MVSLIEIQLRIQFGLTREQLLQSLLMFEGAVCLCLVVYKLLVCPRHATPLIRRQLIQTSQRMLDALDGPNRIRRTQVRGIRSSASDKQLRDTLVVLKEPESAASALAQNLEAAKLTAGLHRLIVSPGEDREGQSLGSFLSRSLARENTIADRHGEVRAFGAVPELDVGFDFCESLLCLGDVTGQVANLPSDVTLLVCMNRAELIERLPIPDRAHVVELGGGTGRNAEFFGEKLARIAKLEIVDVCAPLLAEARGRARRIPALRVVEADATRYRPSSPVDAVYFSYALTMIPGWRAAIANAVAMLRPGGVLGVVDFYVSQARPAIGCARHDAITRTFWPRWFAHDGVMLDDAHLPTLRASVAQETLIEARAKVPFLPIGRVPYYVFTGRKR